jgi:cytochrome c oxidase subunit 4
MDSAVETHADHEEAHYEEHHGDLYYVKIALFLAVITGAEVLWSYKNVPELFLPVLFIMMTVKFVVVVLFFMHLRFDHKLFSFLFWSGLVLALGVYIAALSTMRFFAK